VHLDLTEEELRALIAEFDAIVTNDRYPLSPRIQMLRAFLVEFGEMEGVPPDLAAKLRRYAPPPAPVRLVGFAPARERMRRAARRSWWRLRALRGQLERRIERKYAAATARSKMTRA
jgi:hypothetical protein